MAEFLPVIHNRVRSDGTRHFVQSKSSPDEFHLIVDGVCDCKGFQYRHRCSHLDLLIDLEVIDKKEVDAYRWDASKNPIITANPDIDEYEFWTSRFKDKKVAEDLMYTVRIGRHVPSTITYKVRGVMPGIIPDQALTGLGIEQFVDGYMSQLRRHGTVKVMQAMDRLRKEAQGLPVVLLTEADVFKAETLYDSRRIFADWWMNETGEVIPEIAGSEAK